MARVEVITGPERRRRWSEDQKRAIVTESLVPGAVVSDVARRADIGAGQLHRWRKELRAVADGFAQMLIAPAEIPAAPVATAEPTIELHCTDCQRITGSAFSLGIALLETAFHRTAGEPRALQRMPDSGRDLQANPA